MTVRKRHKRPDQRNAAARHVRLYITMMKTPAWKSLSACARCVYVEIARRYGGLGSNNGRIHFSVREGATELHVSKSTIARALVDLQERGLIVATARGGFNRKNAHASEWLLTEYASDVSSDFPRRDFERWQPSSGAAENQNAVPLAGRVVLLAGQYGPSSGTEAA